MSCSNKVSNNRRHYGVLPHSDYAARARSQRLIDHLHSLGPRSVGEFLDSIARRHDLGEEIILELEGYGWITSEMLEALGGDRWPPAPRTPLRLVSSRPAADRS
jgi:hypothetical protein